LITALYLLYAKLEEEHGLARHAMSVYERATNAVLPEEKFDVISFHRFFIFSYIFFLLCINILCMIFESKISVQRNIFKCL
jgi:hypothetical protein